MRRECWECFPHHRLQRKPLVSNPSMHHGTCVTHVPWCMLGSLTRGGEKNVPSIPSACATRNCTYLARGPWSSYHSHHITCSFHMTQILRKREIVSTSPLHMPCNLNPSTPWHALPCNISCMLKHTLTWIIMPFAYGNGWPSQYKDTI